MADYNSPTYEAERILGDLLRVFKYKPGWNFQINRGFRDMPGHLIIHAQVIDADDHSKTIPIHFGIGLPNFTFDEFPWREWLFDQIIEVERHEAAEFFQIQGEKVFDPHG